jgi:hypothetical protein
MTLYNIPKNVWQALVQTRQKIRYMSAQGISIEGEKKIFQMLLSNHIEVSE